MKLNDDFCTIDKIMLDPLNPRFGIHTTRLSQSAILDKLLEPKGSKELLSSMKENIKWISKIVIRPISTLTPNEKSQYPTNLSGFDYVAVEGNTRLACLKSGKIKHFDSDSSIPVLIAQKDEGENDVDFINELKVTQGISNVMVVKQWGEIAKAKHLYELCLSKIEQNPESNLAAIIRNISLELGMSTNDVRKSINRYAFYKEINQISDTIPDKYWGYLESLDKNATIRKKFGMIDGTLNFEWNAEDDNLYPSLDIKKEFLIEMPSIIKAAEADGLNTKQFRDVFIDLVSVSNDNDLENIKDRLIQTTDVNDRHENWMNIYDRFKNGSSSTEEEWGRKINDAKNVLENLPIQSSWVLEYEDELKKISDSLVKTIKLIEFAKNN
ncbi:hypothetical protein [Bacillus subtilis]|uniref:hypothetical protein n=1 Tax=Bacillus subtilis TaxID=1423 RepID=UPI003C7E23F2